MTSKFSIDNRELLQRISSGEAVVGIDFGNLIVRELAAFRLAAMDSESECLPLDYLQGHKDGLEWAAQLAEANHPETGDWLYYDPIELAKAIRKGPDMPPAQSVADSEPVIVVGDDGGDALSYRRLIQSFEPGTKLYRHAQPAPVAYSDFEEFWSSYIHPLAQDDELKGFAWDIWCAAMLNHPEQHLDMVDHSGDVNEKGGDGNSPAIPDSSASMLRRWLAFGRGMQNAGSQLPHNLIAETESMLAAATQEDINALIPLVSRNEQEVK